MTNEQTQKIEDLKMRFEHINALDFDRSGICQDIDAILSEKKKNKLNQEISYKKAIAIAYEGSYKYYSEVVLPVFMKYGIVESTGLCINERGDIKAGSSLHNKLLIQSRITNHWNGKYSEYTLSGWDQIDIVRNPVQIKSAEDFNEFDKVIVKFVTEAIKP